MSARDDRARDIARWRRLTMTDAELAEIGHAADQKLADEDATAAEKVCTCGALDYQGCFRGLTVGQFLKSPSKLQHLKRV